MTQPLAGPPAHLNEQESKRPASAPIMFLFGAISKGTLAVRKLAYFTGATALTALVAFVSPVSAQRLIV